MQDYTVQPDGTVLKVQDFQELKDQLACAEDALASAQTTKQSQMDYWDAIITEQQGIITVLSAVVGDATSKGAVTPQLGE